MRVENLNLPITLPSQLIVINTSEPVDAAFYHFLSNVFKMKGHRGDLLLNYGDLLDFTNISVEDMDKLGWVRKEAN